MSHPFAKSPWLRYFGAAVLTAIAFGLFFLMPVTQDVPFIFFFAAVACSARFLGFGPSLVSTALSAVLAAYFFMPPRLSILVTVPDFKKLLAFLLVAIIIASIARAKDVVESTAAKAEASYETTLHSIGDAVIATDVKGYITFVNPVAERLTGWTQAEANRQYLTEVFMIVNEGTGEPALDPVTRVIDTGNIVGLANHTALRKRDGSMVPIEDSGAPIRDNTGRLIGVILVFRDVSERRAAELERETSYQFTRRLLDSIGEGFVSFDREMRFVYVNDRAAMMIRQPAEKLLGKTQAEATPGYVGSEFEKAFQCALATGEPQTIEAYYAPFQKWFEGRVYPTGDGLTLFFRDVTERHDQLEVIRLQAERVDIALRASKAGLWEWELQTNQIALMGDEAKLFGLPEDESVADPDQVMSAIHPEDRGRVTEELQRAIKSHSGDYYSEFRVVWPDESLHYLLGVGKVLFGRDGTPERTIGVNVDITQTKLAEEALRNSEKLAATGRLAASVAHEINNPLEAVMNLTYLLRHDPSLSDGASQYLSLIDRELSSVAQLTRQTLRFYRDNNSPTAVNLAEEVRQVISLYQRHLDAKSLRVHCELSDTSFRGFPGEVKQVISNLLTNAVDAAPVGSELRIRTEQREGTSRLAVQDFGSGIAAEVQNRIFEPFFTTKKERGTGLGLWLSRSIVEKHGGHLIFESNGGRQGGGTTFIAEFAGVQENVDEAKAS
jgi:PAS domain S-box-containing protein